MSVKSPRAYAAYARDVPTGGGPACSGSAPDSRPLRARVAVRLRLLVRLGELPHHLLAPLVQSLEPPLLSRSEEHTSELQSRLHLVCRLLLEKKKKKKIKIVTYKKNK